MEQYECLSASEIQSSWSGSVLNWLPITASRGSLEGIG
jgi:hypothetical protein